VKGDFLTPVYIIDDESGVRTMTSALVRELGYLNHPFASAGDFLEALPHLDPGCMLVDLRMDDMSGIDLIVATADVRSRFPAVLLTGFAEVESAVQAMKAGAFDVMQKPVTLAQLSDVLIRSVPRMQPAAPPDLQQKIPQVAHQNALTGRQTDVLQAIVAGKSNKEIARDLSLSTRTVEMHRAGAMAKLGVKSLPELLMLLIHSTGLQDGIKKTGGGKSWN
jgi:two-component system, LuxR family, response regulator FixJ